MSVITGRVQGNADKSVAIQVEGTPACVRVEVYSDHPEKPGEVLRVKAMVTHDAAIDLAIALLEAARTMRAANGGRY